MWINKELIWLSFTCGPKLSPECLVNMKATAMCVDSCIIDAGGNMMDHLTQQWLTSHSPINHNHRENSFSTSDYIWINI